MPRASELGDENGAVPVRHEAREAPAFLSPRCRRLRRPATRHPQLCKLSVQVSDCQHRPSPSLNPRHPHRQQGNWNWRYLLLVGSVVGTVNSVLAVQPNVGEKPIAKSVQAIVLRFFVLPVPTAAQN
jgi:hypothetical protein